MNMTAGTEREIGGLTNVRLSEEYEKFADKKLLAGYPLGDVLWAVATANPLWTLVVDYARVDIREGEAPFLVRSVIVKMGEEVLGNIGATTGYRNGMRRDMVQIESHRLHGVVGGGRTKTRDAKKAINTTKKYFTPSNLSERMSKAREGVDNLLSTQTRARMTMRRRHDSMVNDAMLRYAQNEGYAGFKTHVETVVDKQALDAMAKVAETNLEMATIDEVRRSVEDGKTAVILLDAGNYVVKSLDSVKLYNDNTLPAEISAKLGMLKLVEPEQVVTGIGARVNREVFVVVLSDEELTKVRSEE